MSDITGKRIVVGTVVTATWKNGAKFYTATVKKDNGDGTFLLQYVDGDSDPSVHGSHIKMPVSVDEYLEDLLVVKRKAFHQIPRFEDPKRVYSLEEVRKLANDKTRVVMDQWLKTIPDCPYPEKLSEFNYEYNDEMKLVNKDTKEKFHWAGQRHYDALGDIIFKHIQEIMVSKYGLKEVLLPADDSIHPAFRLNIFMTPDALSNPDKLLLLIQGSGAVRPGQWARALCINDSLDNGAIFKYLEKAKARGYGVIVFNPNAGLVEADLDKQLDMQAAARAKFYKGEKAEAKSEQEFAAGVADKVALVESMEGSASAAADAVKAAADAAAAAAAAAAADAPAAAAADAPAAAGGAAAAAAAAAGAADATASEHKSAAAPAPVSADLPALSAGKKHFLAPDLTKDQIAAKKKATKYVVIKGHGDCEKHSCTVWKEVASKAVAKEIVIIAHSAGGYSTLALLSKHHAEILPRLRSVAFTDAVHEVTRDTPTPVLRFLKANAVNWVTAKTPLDTPDKYGFRESGCARVSAGHDTHEYTSAYAIESVWRLIDSRSLDNPSGAVYDIVQSAAQKLPRGDAAGGCPQA